MMRSGYLPATTHGDEDHVENHFPNFELHASFFSAIGANGLLEFTS